MLKPQYTGTSVTAMDLYCIVGGTQMRILAYAYGGHTSDAVCVLCNVCLISHNDNRWCGGGLTSMSSLMA
jgi:hypothetical protein